MKFWRLYALTSIVFGVSCGTQTHVVVQDPADTRLGLLELRNQKVSICDGSASCDGQADRALVNGVSSGKGGAAIDYVSLAACREFTNYYWAQVEAGNQAYPQVGDHLSLALIRAAWCTLFSTQDVSDFDTWSEYVATVALAMQYGKAAVGRDRGDGQATLAARRVMNISAGWLRPAPFVRYMRTLAFRDVVIARGGIDYCGGIRSAIAQLLALKDLWPSFEPERIDSELEFLHSRQDERCVDPF